MATCFFFFKQNFTGLFQQGLSQSLTVDFFLLAKQFD